MVGKTLKGRYKLGHQIGHGGWSEVYHATDRQTNQPVVAKIMASDLQDDHDNMVLLFQREAVSLLRLHHPHVVRIVDFGEDDGAYYIIMEHDHGLSLFQYLTTQEWPTIAEVVRLMIQIAEALQYLHNMGVIHQDLKPSNVILANGRIDQCKIVDFGCVLLKNLLHRQGRHVITGTFPYISPEQLGGDDREIDHRSDLYSLGVIFYELLSGARPFPPDMTAQDIAQGRVDRVTPPSRLNPLIPEVLDRIVMKLIAHLPDQRYQTTAGLIEDLTHYQLMSTRTVGSPFFRIGQGDAKNNLAFDVPLIGRENELAELRRLMHRSAERGATVLLGGEIGSGKSRLLDEFCASLGTSDYICLIGRCSDANRNFPYFPLIQIFHEYAEYLSTIPDDETKIHRAVVRDVLGPFHSELANIAPAVVDHLPPDSPAAIDDPTTRMVQFLERLSYFFASLAERTKPVILVFEDLHWADAGTCRFLQVLAPLLGDHRNVMIVLSYRSEEVDDRPLLKSLLVRLHGQKSNLQWLRVSPLAPMTVWDFVATIVPEETDGFAELMRLLIEFGRGNPLFLIELIRALMVEGAIVREEGRWRIVRDRLYLPAVGVTLAEIIIRRTKQLSADCKRVLSTASCIGRLFSGSLLADLAARPMKELSPLLEEAIRSRLLMRRAGAEGDVFSFTHDRIHEAFYQNVAPAERKALHLQIAQTLEKQHQASPQKVVYDLAYHFVRTDDHANAYLYALRAASAAENSMAMHQAAQYLEQALELLAQLPNDAAAERGIRERLADVYSFVGAYNKAIDNYNLVRADGLDTFRLAVLERKMGTVYVRRGELPQAIEHFGTGIRQLKGSVSRTHFGAGLSIMWRLMATFASLLIPYRLRRLRFGKRQHQIQELVSIYNVTSFAFFWVDVIRGLETQVKARYLSSFLDQSSAVTRVLDQMIVFWSLFSFWRLSRRNAKRSQSICRKLRDQHALGNSFYFEGLSYQYTSQIETSLEVFEKAIKIHEQIGALFELELEYTSHAQSRRHLGQFDQACDSILKSKEIAEAVKDYRGIADAHYELAEYFYYIGNFEEARRNIGFCFEYCTRDSNPLLYSIGKRVLGKILLRENKTDQAIEVLEESLDIAAGRFFAGEYTIDTSVSLGEALLQRLAEHPESSREDQEIILSKVVALAKQCRKEASTFPNYLGQAWRLKALLLARQGRPAAARRHFEKAMAIQRGHHLNYELARTKAAFAGFLRQSEPELAAASEKEAIQLFEACNARGDLRRLTGDPGVVEAGRISARFSPTSPRGGGGTESSTLDSTLISSGRPRIDNKPSGPRCSV